MVLLIKEAEVKQILTMPLAMDAVEESFRRQASGEAITQPRRRIVLSGKSTLHYMAGVDQTSGYLGMKIYTTSRAGARFLVPLMRADTGEWLALIEGNYLGQIRTGAATGIATKWMARKDASTVGILGTGFQAQTQLQAVALARKLTKVRAFGRDKERRERFAKEMSTVVNVPVEAADSAEVAVRDADIVITATSSVHPVLEGKWLKPGVHVNAIGANYVHKAEIDAEAVARSQQVVVDSLEQAKMEAGDLIQAFGTDAERWDNVTELATVVAGKAPGRENNSKITLFKSVGITTEDVAVAEKIYNIARERGMGVKLPLWD